jgi:hypothetical protein
MRIKIVRSESSEDGGRTWTREWSVVDTDVEPSDHNYYGVLASGCPDRIDAIACAVEHGWLTPGRDA